METKDMEEPLLTASWLIQQPQNLLSPQGRHPPKTSTLPKSQIGGGSFSIVVLSTQMTIACVKSTKTHTTTKLLIRQVFITTEPYLQSVFLCYFLCSHLNVLLAVCHSTGDFSWSEAGARQLGIRSQPGLHSKKCF
uniref:Uncharacterized protein n=1 Tax=Mus musculus TaxID=10090 RepID=Q3UWG2_MOUSE|nr:unnamed protein product [Mus musculus]